MIKSHGLDRCGVRLEVELVLPPLHAMWALAALHIHLGTVLVDALGLQATQRFLLGQNS
jgi:hypothetical protein